MVKRSLRDNKKALLLFALLFISYALIYLTKNCFSAAMAGIVQAGIMTKSETGLLSAMFYLIYAPFQIIGGIAADKISPFKLLVFGFFGAGVCNLLVFFVESYVAILIIWSINAAVQFGVWPSIFKIITTEMSPDKRSFGVCYIGLSSTLGLLISYVSAIFITDWKMNFLMSAIILFAVILIFIPCYLALSKSMVTEEESSNTSSNECEASEAPRTSSKKLAGIIFKSGIPIVMIMTMIQSMINLGLKSLAPVMLMETYGISPALANALNIILVLSAPVGIFTSRIPIFRKTPPAFMLMCVFALLSPLMLVVVFVGKVTLPLILVVLTMVMIIASGSSVFFFYISSTFAKFNCTATISGLSNCMSALGIVLANYVFASMADKSGWTVTAICWLALTVLSLIFAIICVPVWKKFVKKHIK